MMKLYQVYSRPNDRRDNFYDDKIFLNLEDAEKRRKELQKEDDADDGVHEYEIHTLELYGYKHSFPLTMEQMKQVIQNFKDDFSSLTLQQQMQFMLDFQEFSSQMQKEAKKPLLEELKKYAKV